jgi:peptidoglycan-N-acetylmuramic acid deacetylase
MAKKKKKDTKTLKALAIFILVIVAVYIGLSMGENAYEPDSMANDDDNNTIAKQTDNSLDETQTNRDTHPDEQVDNQKNNNEINNHENADNEQDNQMKSDDKIKEETPQDTKEEDENIEEPKTTEEIEDNEKPDVTEETESIEENSKEDIKDQQEVPQGSNIEDESDMSVDTSDLSNKGYSWSFKRNKEHKKVVGYNKFDIKQYDGHYIVDTDEKVVYLTFDEGYENGYTPTILDTLKANDVKVTFFVTKPFIENNAELAKRMKDEGHIVGNHTVHHKRMYELTDEEIIYEIEETARYFEEMTGYKMDNFFRPPEGAYSERSLYLTKKLGYKSIFWSMAYADWDRNNQKGKDYAYNHVTENVHPGMISLLHAVSSSNTEALDDIIKELKEQGYRFGNLYEIQ